MDHCSVPCLIVSAMRHLSCYYIPFWLTVNIYASQFTFTN